MKLRSITKSRPRSRTQLVAVLAACGVIVLLTVGFLVIPLLVSATPATTGAVPVPSATTTAGVETSTPAKPIPTTSALSEKFDARALFAYQSLGADIVRGVPDAYRQANLGKPSVVDWKKAKAKAGPLLATAKIGRIGDPVSKLRAFAELVNNAPRDSIDIAIMMFDYRDVRADTDIFDLFDIYSETMTSLETANPDVVFLYATAPVTTSNSWREVERSSVQGLTDVSQPVWQDNIARERFNALVRHDFAPTGRLFDVASVQATLQGDMVAAKEHESQWYFVMSPGLSKDGSRLNEAGSLRVARAMMELLAAASQ